MHFNFLSSSNCNVHHILQEIGNMILPNLVNIAVCVLARKRKTNEVLEVNILINQKGD